MSARWELNGSVPHACATEEVSVLLKDSTQNSTSVWITSFPTIRKYVGLGSFATCADLLWNQSLCGGVCGVSQTSSLAGHDSGDVGGRYETCPSSLVLWRQVKQQTATPREAVLRSATGVRNVAIGIVWSTTWYVVPQLRWRDCIHPVLSNVSRQTAPCGTAFKNCHPDPFLWVRMPHHSCGHLHTPESEISDREATRDDEAMTRRRPAHQTRPPSGNQPRLRAARYTSVELGLYTRVAPITGPLSPRRLVT